ncbi:hypothetical protein B0H15DRAFT_876211 [Mycena belliarum]|uniref:Protein kinase domain-containing protein n=1 Tax=Mycena belliarum TaxID=1033014 RepID=A0AAD6XZ02_9AGAR|nr:hypothetical protein B0H15DRAFT_876211 [Mycena belliae]
MPDHARELLNQIRQNGGLREREKWWVEHQPFLLSHGYALRPRYDPNWIPTWELPGNEALLPSRFEDSLPIPIPGNVLDARRVADQYKVVLKLVSSSSEKANTWYLGEYLPEMEPDQRNRCVPLLEFIELRDDKKYIGILVLPFLRIFDDPPFGRVSEVAEAVGQFLQATEYMHSKNVAHGDLCRRNLMMDARGLIPNDWHFVLPATYNGVQVSKSLTSQPRPPVSQVNYFVIDFGLTSEFYDGPENVGGKYGQDKTVPEMLEWKRSESEKLKSDKPDTIALHTFDPFKVDIYQLGNVILKLVETYEGLEIFRMLADSMTMHNPDNRPTASECLQTFRALTIPENAPVSLISSSDSDTDYSESDVDSEGSEGEGSQ